MKIAGSRLSAMLFTITVPDFECEINHLTAKNKSIFHSSDESYPIFQQSKWYAHEWDFYK